MFDLSQIYVISPADTDVRDAPQLSLRNELAVFCQLGQLVTIVGTCRVWWGLYLTGVAGVVNTLCAVLTCCAPHKPRYHSPPDFNSE
nr:hypothetical protein BaRGS_021209 [Batillaria attramentaria]